MLQQASTRAEADIVSAAPREHQRSPPKALAVCLPGTEGGRAILA